MTTAMGGYTSNFWLSQGARVQVEETRHQSLVASGTQPRDPSCSSPVRPHRQEGGDGVVERHKEKKENERGEKREAQSVWRVGG